MKLSLIITTYNWPNALSLVLESILRQTVLPDEVIIADDGSLPDTKKVIFQFRDKTQMNIIHIWQKDNGFRAARSRNNAINEASGEYIVLIDGDMILHRCFIQDHLNNSESGYFIQGSRVLISNAKSKKILSEKKSNLNLFSLGLSNRKNSIRSKFLSSVFSNKKNYLSGIRSCNLAFFRKDCIDINGFNNEFEGWGREDSEFVVRLLNSGIKRKNLRFSAIQYHLWHNENSRKMLQKNNYILEETINNSLIRCKNGINMVNNYES